MRSLLLFWLRDFCWYTALDPVHDVGWMKATASHTESLRREQPAQVRASNGFLMTPDELGKQSRTTRVSQIVPSHLHLGPALR